MSTRLGVVAYLKIREGKNAEFETAMRKMCEAVRDNEPNCLYYDAHKGEDATTYVMLEGYASEEAMNAHGQTDHMKQLITDLNGVMAAAPDVKKFNHIG